MDMKSEEAVKIMLVDDRQENLLALEVILTGKNYELIKATSGKEALKILLKEQDFALILMDALMPIMDGFETAEMIRQSEKLKYIPIIFLTAQLSAPDNIFKGYQSGAVDYMLKPLAPEILKAKVSVFVDLYKKNKAVLAQAEDMKKLNDQLRQQSQYVRSLIEAGLDPLITINSKGKITDVNSALENITGIPRQRLINSDFFNYFTEPEKARKVYEVVFEKGSIIDSLLTLRHKDGTLIDVLFNGSVYKDDKGNVLGVVVVAREKLLSKYARSLIEASLDPLITINSEGKITDMNHALETITGLSRGTITGNDFSNYFTDQEKAHKVYREIFSKGFVVNYPLTIRDKSEKFIDVLFNGSIYKDSRGNTLGAVIVARDVTEQKRFEQELIEAKKHAEEAKKIAEEAVKSKQQFLSNMSHEIRTPMNAIIGFTKVILKTDLSDKQKEYLNAIKVSGDSLIVLINDILDLAKVDAGKMTFEKIPFKLSSPISAIVLLFQPKVQENNVELIKNYDDSIPEVLVGDPVRLQQIILNLLSNAVKFTSVGKITLDVKLVKEDKDEVSIEFSVSDTGIGIPENKIGEIFDNFQQATSKTTRLFGGTGLGLAIVKQLVEAQKGNLKVKSKVGEGSTFSFTLNFKKTSVKIEAETENGTEQEHHVGDVRVLVAEDVTLNQLLMKTVMQELGFSLDIAKNGKIALEYLEKNDYDIILMDLQMPEMDGFEATEYIRKNMHSKIPIIALTADVTAADVEKCKSMGMNDYISKPVDEKLLYKKILKQLRRDVNGDGVVKTNGVNKKNIHEERCTNLNFLNELTRGNPKMIIEMITVYLEETPKLISRIKTALEKNDWDSLARVTHALIPSFSTVGINEAFTEMARQIYENAQKKENSKLIKDLLMTLEAVCSQACSELKQEMEKLEKLSV